MKLGVIGDDFTGSSDIGLMLAGAGGEGLATVQYVGVPARPADPGVEAGIVALKSRSTPVAEAVGASLDALAWLREQGAETILFKICSTFDSTPDGNIGPVAEALIEAMGTQAPVIVCPAFPATGRSVYRGHLFVGDRLLSESGLENHPLNPLTAPDLARWLARQTRGPVGRVGFETILEGPDAGRAALEAERDAGRQLVVCDAVRDEDLRVLGAAMVRGGFPLAVCGSGLAIGLPDLLRSADSGTQGRAWQGVEGPAVALSGSCSRATREQVAAHEAAGAPVRRIDVDEAVTADEGARAAMADALADWAMERASGPVPLLLTSDDPDAVRAVQARHGRERSAEAIEALFGALARTLVARGAARIVSAGGETSGAVVTALGLEALEIGPMIDPGVPAVASRTAGDSGDRRVALALKSGNFGAPDFFAKAARVLSGDGA